MFQVGTRVGDYEILDILYSSRKEVYYKVRNTVAQRIEAMKVLPESLQKDQEAQERFFREIKVHARLQHPNIVAFYNATQLNGIPVMTTELVDGITLADKLELGAIPLPQAISLLQPVLAALSHAHSQNIIHREVTPEHIILTEDGSVKLSGFGLAKAQGDVGLTQLGTTLGPVHYMSPEQVKGAALIDHRSDIYSAGVVLYEMLTGHKPFQAKSDFDVMLAQVQRDPVPVASINRELPPMMDLITGRAMAKRADDRYHSAAAFSLALHEVAHAGRAASDASQEPRPAPAEEIPAVSKMVPAPATVAAATQRNDRIFALLVVLTVAIILLWSATLLIK
ncbi:MAG: serine/threonine protein kinase [Acidobacteria bacterium]|nr:serine/threonine protein kinase [Acidobacteriota bacterium]